MGYVLYNTLEGEYITTDLRVEKEKGSRKLADAFVYSTLAEAQEAKNTIPEWFRADYDIDQAK